MSLEEVVVVRLTMISKVVVGESWDILRYQIVGQPAGISLTLG